ncbi:hypothetical protein Poly21_21790 [Allorhodopirellula heiligendammensis]|uniref:Uncharacterized protein n=1 Tax=Allorhodopirellula heiligendammensis TaxID=2714739 RepID=A0A5C6C5T9_9BACT|nr:hypothetical protein Poly21_21790 [Allorhodopirellula heiligendammensis]
METDCKDRFRQRGLYNMDGRERINRVVTWAKTWTLLLGGGGYVVSTAWRRSAGLGCLFRKTLLAVSALAWGYREIRLGLPGKTGRNSAGVRDWQGMSRSMIS